MQPLQPQTRFRAAPPKVQCLLCTAVTFGDVLMLMLSLLLLLLLLPCPQVTQQKSCVSWAT